MFYRYRNGFARFIYDFSLRKARDLPQIILDSDSNAVLVTMLQKKDITMYLLAVLSFVQYVKVTKIFVINDDSLNPTDIQILKAVIPKITILNKTSFRSQLCPKDGTWERLLAISELVNDYYVVQLDADTLSINPILDVQNCIFSQTAFTLGTATGRAIESMESRIESARALLEKGYTHVQHHTEANLDKIDDYKNLKYVRGCSGFAGFPHKSFSKDFIENTSSRMFSVLGDKWAEWGSEQVTSNIVVANIKASNVLPYPEYCSVDQIEQKTCFVHFIGTCRFKNGIYINKSKEILNKVLSDSARLH